jgi:hypothetical protein
MYNLPKDLEPMYSSFATDKIFAPPQDAKRALQI